MYLVAVCARISWATGTFYLNFACLTTKRLHVAHALQVLIENAIGKSKHLLKSKDVTVPVSAYDAFASLEQHGFINSQELEQWNSVIGLRNRIVHDYMNIDMQLIYELITKNRHQLIAEFLRKPM